MHLCRLRALVLLGGPAYNDNEAAVQVLSDLNVPYVAAQPLEFQTLEQWEDGSQGLNPIESTMLIALPEIDGATNPTVFAGRHEESQSNNIKAMAPALERIDALVEKTKRLALLRRKA